MDKHDHWILFAALDFRRRHQPTLNIRAFVRPLDAFGFAPVRLQPSVVVRQLTPFADWTGKDFGWRVIRTAHDGGEVAILRQSEVWKVSKCVYALRALPDRSCRIVGRIQLRNCAAATDVLDKQNSTGCLPEK